VSRPWLAEAKIFESRRTPPSALTNRFQWNMLLGGETPHFCCWGASSHFLRHRRCQIRRRDDDVNCPLWPHSTIKSAHPRPLPKPLISGENQFICVKYGATNATINNKKQLRKGETLVSEAAMTSHRHLANCRLSQKRFFFRLIIVSSTSFCRGAVVPCFVLAWYVLNRCLFLFCFVRGPLSPEN